MFSLQQFVVNVCISLVVVFVEYRFHYYYFFFVGRTIAPLSLARFNFHTLRLDIGMYVQVFTHFQSKNYYTQTYLHLPRKFLCFQNSLDVCVFLPMFWKILLKIIALANKVSIFVKTRREKTIILGNLWCFHWTKLIHSFHLPPMFASSILLYCDFVDSLGLLSFFSWRNRVVVFANWMKKDRLIVVYCDADCGWD